MFLVGSYCVLASRPCNRPESTYTVVEHVVAIGNMLDSLREGIDDHDAQLSQFIGWLVLLMLPELLSSVCRPHYLHGARLT
jgi:hypothetical protein